MIREIAQKKRKKERKDKRANALKEDDFLVPCF